MFITIGKFEFVGREIVLAYTDTKQEADQVAADIETDGGDFPECYGSLKQVKIFETK